VAVRIVDPLEIVDIRHQKRDCARRALGPLDLLVQAGVEVPPVEQAGQRIDGRGVRQTKHLAVAAGGHQRQRSRHAEGPERGDVVAIERGAVDLVGCAQDAEGLAARSKRDRRE